MVESAQKLLGTLRNVYSFYAMYAAVDGYVYDPSKAGEPNLLDRWILSRFHSTVGSVTRHLDAYDPTRAARCLQTFVLDELSNWYVRRSRRRFWKGEMGPDKTAAYHTIFTVLDGAVRLLAPFTPFIAEEIYLGLRGIGADATADASVHLEPYPVPDPSVEDRALGEQMEAAMMIASLGRHVRNDAGVRVRQPLSELVVHGGGPAVDALLANEEIVSLVRDELNVRTMRAAGSMESFATLTAVPSYPALGKRFGKLVPAVAEALKRLGTGALAEFGKTGEVLVETPSGPATLTRDELTVKIEGKSPYAAKEDRGVTVALNLEITDSLRLEGLAREVVNRLQNLRKKAGFAVTDRIRIRYGGGEVAGRVFAGQGVLIESETLAVEVAAGPSDWTDGVEFEIDGDSFQLWIAKAGD